MRYFIFIVALMLSFSASAQNIDRIRRGLVEGSKGGGSVVVLEGDGVAEAVATVEAKRTRKTLNGYRIVIYSDNSQYAGDKARAVLGGFKSRYPGISAYLVYESPYFKVLVGNCVSKEEAQILLSKLQGSYPSAFPRNESIPLSALTAPLKRASMYSGNGSTAAAAEGDEHEELEVDATIVDGCEELQSGENREHIEGVDSLSSTILVAE